MTVPCSEKERGEKWVVALLCYSVPERMLSCQLPEIKRRKLIPAALCAYFSLEPRVLKYSGGDAMTGRPQVTECREECQRGRKGNSVYVSRPWSPRTATENESTWGSDLDEK